MNKILARRVVRKMGQMNGCHYDDDLDLPSPQRNNVAEIGRSFLFL
jgi:hypothetical protein